MAFTLRDTSGVPVALGGIRQGVGVLKAILAELATPRVIGLSLFVFTLCALIPTCWGFLVNARYGLAFPTEFYGLMPQYFYLARVDLVCRKER